MIANRPLLLTSGLRSSAARAPGKIAIHCHGEGTRTYAELVDRINRVRSTAIAMWSVQPGDSVALFAPNCLEYCEVVAGLSEAGAAVATINYRLSAPELADILRNSGSKLVLCHGDFQEVVSQAVSGLEFAPIVANIKGPLLHMAKKTGPTIDETACFSVPYTSGTTGQPKGVMISHRARVLTFYAMAAEYQCFSSESRFLAITPLCHGAGFAFGFAPLFFGGTLELMPRFDAERVIDTLVTQPVDGMFVVPTMLRALFDQPDAVLDRARGRHGLKAIISNAAPLPQSLKEQAIRYFGDGLLHETYGSTEAGIVTNLRPADQLRKPHSVGPAFVDTEVSLRDEQGSEVAPGEPGELFSRGPGMFSGYWQRPEATAEAVRDGWVSVGDVATRDEDGYITIVDRKKDMIISGGINIYPREIETVLLAHEHIADAAAFGIADPRWGEAIHAAVVVRPGAALSEAELAEWAQSRLARFKLPRRFHMIDALPRNAGGKLLKRVLTQTYSQS